MASVYQGFVNRRKLFFCATIAVILFFSFFLKNLAMDNSVSIWFLDDDPAFEAYQDFQENFGNDDVVTLFISAPEGVLQQQNLTLIEQVSDALEQSEWVEEVLSLSHAKYMDATRDENLVIENLYGAPPRNEEDVAEIRRRVDSWPALQDLLLNKDRDGTLIMARLRVIENIDAMRGEIIEALEDTINPIFAQAGKTYEMAGIGVVYNALNKAAIEDSAIFTTLSYAAIFLCLLLLLGSWLYTFVAMGVIYLAMMLTLGVYTFGGNAINMVTMILPTLIMVIGISDMVHILVHYIRCCRENPAMTRREAMVDTLEHLVKPCLFTSVTTAIGFLALVSSPMEVIKLFGFYAALGVILTLVVSLVLAVFFCLKIAPPGEKTGHWTATEWINGAVAKLLRGIARLSTGYPVAVLAGGLVLFVVGLVGLPHLEVNTYPIRYLNEKDPTRIAHEVIEKKFGSFIPLEFTIRTESPETITDPAFLEKLKLFQEKLAQDPEVGQSYSIVDLVEFLNQSFNEGQKTYYRIPETSPVIAQLLEVYRMDENNDLAAWAGPDDQEARVTAYTRMMSAGEYGSLCKRAEKIFEETGFDPRHIAENGFRPSGYLPLYVLMNEYVLSSQTWSFVIAFLLIFALFGVVFRSLRILLICMFTNLLPPVFILGFMGLADITLDMGTAMIAAIMLGIVVDDTIHFMHRFREEQADGGRDISDTIRSSLRICGPAIVTTSIILVAGFFFLSLASIQSIANFGKLCALTVVVALLSDLLVLPSLLKLSYRKV